VDESRIAASCGVVEPYSLYVQIRIRIQHFQTVLDPDSDVQNAIFSKNFKSSAAHCLNNSRTS
jgi:hypothetical protein